MKKKDDETKEKIFMLQADSWFCMWLPPFLRIKDENECKQCKLFILKGWKKNRIYCQRIAHDKYNLLLDVTNDNKMEDGIILLFDGNARLKEFIVTSRRFFVESLFMQSCRELKIAFNRTW